MLNIFSLFFFIMSLLTVEKYYVYLPLVTSHNKTDLGAGATYGDCERIATSGIEWFYDWSSNPPICPSAERVAMIYGRNIPESINTEWILGFNEPESETQSNISPQEGAVLWRQIEKFDAKLVSPSASIGWLTEWYNEYELLYGKLPRIDAVASHCYGPWDTARAISWCKATAKNVVDWAIEREIGEVWITEFAMLPCWEGQESSIEFMREMVSFYREEPIITRWAWFQTSYYGSESWSFGPQCNTSLVDINTNQLTDMGIAYKELK